MYDKKQRFIQKSEKVVRNFMYAKCNHNPHFPPALRRSRFINQTQFSSRFPCGVDQKITLQLFCSNFWPRSKSRLFSTNKPERPDKEFLPTTLAFQNYSFQPKVEWNDEKQAAISRLLATFTRRHSKHG
jgi:hypothetical protein